MVNTAKKTFREITQIIIISTSFPPLIYLYRKIYDLSIALAVIMLRRVKGISAIYLRRGLAKGEAIFGLSDVDLSIIMEDNEKQAVKLTKERIISIYNNLAFFIPFLGKADEELELYTISDFSRLYKSSNFLKYKISDEKYSWKLKHRFQESKQSWVLLHGRDIVRDFPRLEKEELYIPAAQELKVWWGFLAAELNPYLYLPDFKRKYIFYKAIAEAARTYLFIAHDKEIGGRKPALTKVKKYLSHGQNLTIKKVENYLKNLTKKEKIITDDLMKLYMELSIDTLRAMEQKLYTDLKSKTARLWVPGCSDLMVTETTLKSINELREYVEMELRSYISKAVLIPQIEFSIDVLSNNDIDAFYFVLFQKHILPARKLRKLNQLLTELGISELVEPFVTDGKIAFSLQAKEPNNSIKSLRENPLFFSLLSYDSLEFINSTNEGEDKYIKVILPSDSFEEIIWARTMEIHDIVTDKKVYKMRILNFLKFFWGATRTKLLAKSIPNNEIYIPITSKQILKMLVESYSKDVLLLNELYSDYIEELSGNESDAYRLYTRSIDFLRSL